MGRGKRLSQDACDMIRYMHEERKLSHRQIGELVGRTRGSIRAVLKTCDPVTGTRAEGPRGRPQKTTEQNNILIRQLALANPYVSVKELTNMYNDTTEKKLSKESVFRRLRLMGIESVKLPITNEELEANKQFPKSQTVAKFVETKKSSKKKKEKHSVEEGEMPPFMSFSPTMAVYPLPLSDPREVCEDTTLLSVRPSSVMKNEAS